MTEAVERWLAECTDGRVSSHTITMLNSFSRWQEAAQAQQASTEAAWCDDTLPCARYTEALRARDERIAELERERDNLSELVRGWHYLAVGPDEMGDYYTQKQLIKLSEPYASPALKALKEKNDDA